MEAKKDFTSTAHAAYFTPNSIDSKPLNFLLIQGLKVFPWVFLYLQFVWAINFVASLSKPSNYFHELQPVSFCLSQPLAKYALSNKATLYEQYLRAIHHEVAVFLEPSDNGHHEPDIWDPRLLLAEV